MGKINFIPSQHLMFYKIPGNTIAYIAPFKTKEFKDGMGDISSWMVEEFNDSIIFKIIAHPNGVEYMIIFPTKESITKFKRKFSKEYFITLNDINWESWGNRIKIENSEKKRLTNGQPCTILAKYIK